MVFSQLQIATEVDYSVETDASHGVTTVAVL